MMKTTWCHIPCPCCDYVEQALKWAPGKSGGHVDHRISDLANQEVRKRYDDLLAELKSAPCQVLG
jgi:hypothetical protein